MAGSGAHDKPRAIAFDIIGTTFPLDPLRPDIADLGLPPAALEGWFAAGLRDAFALAAARDFAPLAKILEAALHGTLAEQGLSASSAQVKAIVERLGHLPPRPDAVAAFRRAKDAGCIVIALTNGSASSTRSLLDGADLQGLVDHLVSVDEVELSKPAAEVYHRATRTAEVLPNECALVASHTWDINGAAAAGMVTAYLTADRPFSPVMRKPDVTGDTLVDCVEALLAL